MVEKNDDNMSQDEIEVEAEATDSIDPELTDIEEQSNDTLKKMRAKLKACEQEKMEHLENLQRTKADFLNSKRRLEEQLQNDRKRITMEHIEDLLPLCDSFDMAMSDTKAWEACDEKWRKGIEGINSQLRNILKSHNVSEIEATGDAFNPHEHEAVSSEPGDPDTVLRVLQKGYRQGDTILRHAKVVVGTAE